MALTTKQKALYIFGAVLTLIAGFSVWHFFLRGADCDPNNIGYDKKGKLSDKCKKATPPSSTEVSPSGSQWKPESFPLQKGMWGDKIKIMQQKLNIDADGKFGNVTERAVQDKLNGKSEVSIEDYAKLVPATTGTTQIDIGKVAYANQDGVKVFNLDFTLYKTAKKDEWVGKITSIDGGYYNMSGNHKVNKQNVYLK